jgi:hypothetical protein
MRTEASGSGNKVAERLPNNGMHPTANSAAFICETCFNSAVRRGG